MLRCSKYLEIGSAFYRAIRRTQVNCESFPQRLNFYLAKVGIERSNRFTRSNFLREIKHFKRLPSGGRFAFWRVSFGLCRHQVATAENLAQNVRSGRQGRGASSPSISSARRGAQSSETRSASRPARSLTSTSAQSGNGPISPYGNPLWIVPFWPRRRTGGVACLNMEFVMLKTTAMLLCLVLVGAVATGCANRSCRDWPGTCIIQ